MIPVTNNTAMPMYVGVHMIPAGETRHFPLDQVPEHLRPAAPEPEAPQATADPVADLLEGSVADIVPQLDALTTEQLEALGEREQVGKARKTLLAEIAERLLKRAGGEGGGTDGNQDGAGGA